MTTSLTIAELFTHCVQERGEQPALGLIEQGELRWETWAEIDAGVEQFANAFAALGVSAGTHVGHVSNNCREWILVDLALHLLGAVHVPLHRALPDEQLRSLAAHAECKLVVSEKAGCEFDCESVGYSELANRPKTLRPSKLRPSKPRPSEGTDGRLGQPSPAATASDPPEGRVLSHQAGPDALATILYTSGTTGTPRGVMLSHGNLASNATAVTDAVAPPREETRLAFLPFSHIYGRTCDLYSWIYRGTKLVLAESRDTILRDCQLAQPSTLNGVPYFYQKIADQLQADGASFNHAKLVNLLGGNIRRLSCGGAALSPQVEQLFAQCELPVLSGYGLTEASPVVTATAVEQYLPGTVGRPIPETEVKLADDGEVLVRGPGVMLGYWQDELATSSTLRDDSVHAGDWLHTGDLGRWEGQNLQIIGRKKELLALSTGKKVVPTAIEQRLVGSPLIEQACVVGDGQKYLAALIVPNPDALRAEIRRQRLWVWSKRRAVTHPKVLAAYRQEIDRVLSGVGGHEQIGTFRLLSRGFSLELGEFTPKMSLNRAAVATQWNSVIEQMYS